eukprot:TRINITY_DN3148_c0_g1_i4.p1 TRINITY_DN3148_c0_g1~~TRINITY_DN3148_c0_g1_i4.p1  ORF type:complete len:418 (-),score=50.27 TRINITY_DN3148_c0_g1_i4:258-1511(-)
MPQGKLSLLGAHGKYVCAEPNGRAVCDRDALGSWETFELVSLGSDQVALKSAHGAYLCAEPFGRVVCDRVHRREWETWTVCRLADDQVALRSWHGRYLSAQPDGRLQANRRDLLAWETFRVPKDSPLLAQQPQHAEPCTLRAELSNSLKLSLQGAHGTYVCAEPNGRVVCNRDVLGSWETFELVSLGADQVALKSAHGAYLCAEPFGRVVCDRVHRREWETWTVCRLADDQVALRSWHGRYLSAQPDGRLQANRRDLLAWETFRVPVDVPLLEQLPQHLEPLGPPALSFFEWSNSNKLALRSVHGKYVCAEPDGPVVCDRHELGPWKTFEVVSLGDKVALKSCHGTFLCDEPDGGGSACSRREPTELETWTVEQLEAGFVGLKSWQAKYLSAQPDGRLEASRDNLDTWERFAVESPM